LVEAASLVLKKLVDLAIITNGQVEVAIAIDIPPGHAPGTLAVIAFPQGRLAEAASLVLKKLVDLALGTKIIVNYIILPVFSISDGQVEVAIAIDIPPGYAPGILAVIALPEGRLAEAAPLVLKKLVDPHIIADGQVQVTIAIDVPPGHADGILVVVAFPQGRLAEVTPHILKKLCNPGIIADGQV
jgi:hypothetical protein